MKEKKPINLVSIGLLSVIVLLTVTLRLLFPTGLGDEPSLTLYEDAWKLSQSMPNSLSDWIDPQAWDKLVIDAKALRAENGFRYVALTAPTALAYYFFGLNDLAGIVFPMLLSLFLMVEIFFIGKLIGGIGSGLFAAYFWALLPLDVFASTTLSITLAMIFLYGGVILFMLIAEKKKSLVAFGVGLGLLLMLTLFYPVLGLSALIWIVLWILWTRKRSIFSYVVFSLAVIWVASLVYSQSFAQAFADQFNWLFDDGESLLFVPVFIIAAVFALTRNRWNSIPLFLWIGSVYLLTAFANNYYPYPQLFWEDIVNLNHTLLFIPFVILVGVFVARSLPDKILPVTLLYAFAIVSLTAILLSGVGINQFLLSFQVDMLRHSTASILGLVVGVNFLLVFLTAILNTRSLPLLKTRVLMALVIALGLSCLSFISLRQEAYTYQGGVVKKVVSFLDQYQHGIFIYASDERLRLMLEYYSNLAETKPPGEMDSFISVAIVPRDIHLLNVPSLIVIWESQLGQLPLVGEHSEVLKRFDDQANNDLLIYKISDLYHFQ